MLSTLSSVKTRSESYFLSPSIVLNMIDSKRGTKRRKGMNLFIYIAHPVYSRLCLTSTFSNTLEYKMYKRTSITQIPR